MFLDTFRTGSLVLLGKRGSGKSLLAVQAAQFRPAGLIVDTLGDIEYGKPVDFSGLARCSAWGRVNVVSESDRSGVFPSVYAPALFNAVLRLAKAGLLPKPYCVLIDEADAYGSAATNNEALREIARYGRHWGLSYIITARRYAEIPKEWTGGADLILMGPSLDPRDADVVRRISGAYANYWKIIRPFEFLGISLDGAALVTYDSNGNRVTAKPVGG